MALLKWTIFVMINSDIFLELRSQMTEHQELFANRSTTYGIQPDVFVSLKNYTKIVLSCAVMYTVTRLPNVIHNCLKVAAFFSFTNDLQEILAPTAYLLNLSNYSLNFLLYNCVLRNCRTKVFQIITQKFPVGKQAEQTVVYLHANSYNS